MFDVDLDVVFPMSLFDVVSLKIETSPPLADFFEFLSLAMETFTAVELDETIGAGAATFSPLSEGGIVGTWRGRNGGGAGSRFFTIVVPFDGASRFSPRLLLFSFIIILD